MSFELFIERLKFWDGNILSVIIAVVSLIISYLLGVYITKKYTSKKEISYERFRFFSLYTDAISNTEGLTINFEGKPIEKTLCVIKGRFINTGIDISHNCIELPLTINLLENSRWIKCKITEKSNDLKLEEPEIESNKLKLKWISSLKKNEFFEFSSLAEIDKTILDKINSGEKFSDYYTIKGHRILDLDDNNINEIELQKSISKTYIGIFVGIIFFLGLFLFDSYLSNIPYYEGGAPYDIKINNNTYENVFLSADLDNVFITDKATDERLAIIDINEIPMNNIVIKNIHPDKKTMQNILSDISIASVTFKWILVFILIILFILLLFYKKSKRQINGV